MPLADWADAQLAALANSFGKATPSGSNLLSQRALLRGFRVPGRTSAGGGCRLYETSSGYVALNLARREDQELLPALFGKAEIIEGDIDAHMTRHSTENLVSHGREMGLAIAALDERPASPACTETARGSPFATASRQPLIVDLSALWAGPLAVYLLMFAEAHVVKVESTNRPDAMRWGDPELFAQLNQGKEQRALDLRTAAGGAALLDLIGQADIVIEAARPRALRQLGIDADALVRDRPGLIWVTITGHGAAGDAENWIAFGDDAAVAGGLSAALRDASGQVGFVGDAIADPLTGIFAARIAAEALARRRGTRLIVSMSGVVAEAIAWSRERDTFAFDLSLLKWAASGGASWPTC